MKPETIFRTITTPVGNDDHGMVCTICGKVYRDKFTCRKHYQTIHLKRRDYACIYCQKLFSQKGNRCRHELVCKHKRPLPPPWSWDFRKGKYESCWLFRDLIGWIWRRLCRRYLFYQGRLFKSFSSIQEVCFVVSVWSPESFLFNFSYLFKWDHTWSWVWRAVLAIDIAFTLHCFRRSLSQWLIWSKTRNHPIFPARLNALQRKIF